MTKEREYQGASIPAGRIESLFRSRRVRRGQEAVTMIGENGTVRMSARDRRNAMKWWRERGVTGPPSSAIVTVSMNSS
jgi:hypothetical protein